jgi:poly(hydroxyalkanoate) depolymerase family esterase
MRTISDTIARLAALRAAKGFPNVDLGKGRLADLVNFGTNPGALRAKTYLPDKLPDAGALVVVLHGCTQSAAGYDHGAGWSELADQEGFALLFPQQQPSNNANLCFNWFLPGDTRRNRGEALSIFQMIETLVVAHGLDRRRIFVTGLSAGGAMTSVMLATYPEVFAGGAIIAGLPYGVADTIPEAFDRMRGHGGPSERQLQKLLRGASAHKGPWPLISVWHGSADTTVVSSNADAIVRQWRAVHGLASTAARSETVNGHERRVWCDAQGREVIEEYSIRGMGHGTPLATAGDDRLGAGGPFMLDAGISSTRLIAQFWGIAKRGEKRRSPAKAARAEIELPVANGTRAILKPGAGISALPRATSAREEKERPSQLPRSAVSIRKVIEDALRSAGLMR